MVRVQPCSVSDSRLLVLLLGEKVELHIISHSRKAQYWMNTANCEISLVTLLSEPKHYTFHFPCYSTQNRGCLNIWVVLFKKPKTEMTYQS
jgi:hypothetical protein